MTKPLHPALRPNPTIPTPIPTSAEQAARARTLEAWTRRWGTPDELVLLASSRGEARNLNRLVRSALRGTGRLAGPSVNVGDLELTPGDRVVAGPRGISRPGELGIPSDCPGDVRLVDPRRQAARLPAHLATRHRQFAEHDQRQARPGAHRGSGAATRRRSHLALLGADDVCRWQGHARFERATRRVDELARRGGPPVAHHRETG